MVYQIPHLKRDDAVSIDQAKLLILYDLKSMRLSHKCTLVEYESLVYIRFE